MELSIGEVQLKSHSNGSPKKVKHFFRFFVDPRGGSKTYLPAAILFRVPLPHGRLSARRGELGLSEKCKSMAGSACGQNDGFLRGNSEKEA